MHPLLLLDNPYVPPHVTYSWFVIIVLAGVAFLATRRLSVRNPGHLQNIMETVVEAVYAGIDQVIGPKGKPYFPLIATISVYIITCNLLGIIPGFESPTANLNTTASVAICVFFSYHYIGIRLHGVKYVKHFTGGMWAMAPLMVPIEIISHFSRPLSLSVRLFGNIMGEDVLLAIILILVPFLIPLPIYVLMVFTSIIQMLVFVILSMIYISLAVEESH